MPSSKLVFILSEDPGGKLPKDFATFLREHLGAVAQRVAYRALRDDVRDGVIFAEPYQHFGHYEARVHRLAEVGNQVFVLAEGQPYEQRDLSASVLKPAGGTEPGRLAGLEGMVHYTTIDRTGFEAVLKGQRPAPAETALVPYFR